MVDILPCPECGRPRAIGHPCPSCQASTEDSRDTAKGRSPARGWSRRSPLRIAIALAVFFGVAYGGVFALHLYNHARSSSVPLMGANVSPALQTGPSKSQTPDTTVGVGAPEGSSSFLPVKEGTPQSWALATSALLTAMNGKSFYLLSESAASPETVSQERQSLQDWWGIGNRADLFAALQWIKDGGHRKEWDRAAQYVATLNDDQFAAVQAAAASDLETKTQLEIVRKYGPAFGAKSLLGWDYSRYVSLCRWGYLCGYLSDSEAWAQIMPAARLLQRTFSSWADLGKNYLVGREFWSPAETATTGANIQAAYDYLVKDPGSPWNLDPWDLDLGPDENGTIF